ncbi:hypothetical protein INR49_000147 [Caranx melampygus]|nr:hypothetical protein INR49_000147 [Caranx melampygus]
MTESLSTCEELTRATELPQLPSTDRPCQRHRGVTGALWYRRDPRQLSDDLMDVGQLKRSRPSDREPTTATLTLNHQVRSAELSLAPESEPRPDLDLLAHASRLLSSTSLHSAVDEGRRRTAGDGERDETSRADEM